MTDSISPPNFFQQTKRLPPPSFMRDDRLSQPPNFFQQGQHTKPSNCMGIDRQPHTQSFFQPNLQDDQRSGYQSEKPTRITHGMGSNRKPPEFDGKSRFHDFLVQFELISELNGWDHLLWPLNWLVYVVLQLQC